MSGDILFFETPADFRDWLAESHELVDVQWVGFYKKATGRPSISWEESVDEALCFGWIDGLRKKVDEESYKIRFTPRRPSSTWSARNVDRARAMIDEGRMQEAGQREFDKRREDKSAVYAYEQDKKEVAFAPEHEAEFKKNPKAWEHFQSQAPYYRRKATYWVISAKKEETRRRRLAQVIEHSAKEALIPPMDRKKS